MSENACPLTDSQLDRVAGVLLAQACGDALGAPFEFGYQPDPDDGDMAGGGPFDFAAGEWTDDTQMSLYIARVAAPGADLTSEDALDQVAEGFVEWALDGVATDVGAQTAQVIQAVAPTRGRPGLAARMRRAAADLHERTGRTAGNGALMRNGVVALTRLKDPQATAAAARAVAELTHADPLAGDSCVIHAELIRSHIMSPEWLGQPFHGANVLATLDLLPAERRGYWHELFDSGDFAAQRCEHPASDDGFTVSALGNAALAFTWANRFAAASGFASADRLAVAQFWMEAVLRRAVASSQDTDTVGAIAGAVAGAYLGASALPEPWLGKLRGKPFGHRAGTTAQDTAWIGAAELRAWAQQTALAGLAA